MLSQNEQLNIIFLPFVSPGHIIPMIDVARIFANLGATVTIVTTAANAALFHHKIHRDSLSGRRIHLHTIPWPDTGPENLSAATTPLELSKVFQTFFMLQPQLQLLLHELRPDCIVADMFYPWTTAAATELGIPRLAFHGSSFFAYCVEHSINKYKPHLQVKSDDDKFQVPGLPDLVEMTKSQLPNWIVNHDELSQLFDAIRESEKRSYGMLMNSFYEMENPYEQHLNKEIGIRTWSIGPVSLLANKEALDKTHRGENPSIETSELLPWLDEKEPNSVLYISFGSLVQMKPNQISEIAHAIESSGHNFIWVIKKTDNDEEEEEAAIDERLPKGFEENMKKTNKGLIIRGWAPQLMILEHEAVGGFITHCGWNSILECVSSGLPMITWPLFAEQFYNEKLLIDVLNIGVGIIGSKKWWDLGEERGEVVKREDIGEAVGFLMGGSGEAMEMRKRAKEMGEAAKRAVSSGGLSEINLVSLFKELQAMKLNRQSNGVG